MEGQTLSHREETFTEGTELNFNPDDRITECRKVKNVVSLIKR